MSGRVVAGVSGRVHFLRDALACAGKNCRRVVWAFIALLRPEGEQAVPCRG
ncbi:hypothetical protein AB9K41_18880 [Cribrihabitans sp. XS_ASV171]